MDTNKLSNLDLSVLDNLSEEEKKFALKLLKEYADTGYSKTYEELRYADYEEIPVDIETFLHDRKYLGNGLYDADGRFTLYPYWETKLKEIFPDNITTAYNTVVLTGAIGLGKSLVAVIILLYMLYRLLCLKDPYVYYGLQSIDKLTISLMNITIENAKGVALDKMNQFILGSEWFLSHGEMAGQTNLVYRPQKHIEIIAASSNNQIIGRCLFCNFTDEINFSLTSNIVKAKEKAKKMITQIDARQRSRFLRGEYLPTINIIASSKDSEQSFLEDYIKNKKENESKTTLIVDEPQWVVDSRKDSPKKFWVAIGNKFLANDLLPVDADDSIVDLYRAKGYNMLHVPMGYLETFQQNLDEAICSIAGIATASSLKFISGARWNEIKTDSYVNPFTKEILEIGNSPLDHYQYSNFFDLNAIDRNNISDPLFIHLDMSTTGDKTGIAGIWIVGKKPKAKALTTTDPQFKPEEVLNTNENSEYISNELQYKLAFHVAIKAPKGYQISFEKHRIFIRWLREKGFNIKGITSDTFQSAQLQQQLSADGFKVDILSVDRIDSQTKQCLPYQFFKTSIYEQDLIAYKKCDLLTEEIAGLEKEADGHINHPDNGRFGSKDCADAVCGALYNASKFAEEYEYSYGQKEALEQTMLLNGDSPYDNEAYQLTINLENELRNLGPVLNSNRIPTHPSNVDTSTTNYTLLNDDIIIL